MTHRFLRFFLPLLLLGAMASTAVGQQEGSGAKTPEQKLAEQRLQPRIGLFGNLGLNIHSSQFFGIPGTPNCMALDDVGFTGGTGMGYAAGLTFELPFDEQFRLIARAGLYSLAATQTADAHIGPIVVGNDTASGISQYSLDATLGMLGGELLLGWRPIQDMPLTVRLGPEIGVFMTKEFAQQEQLISPSSATFIGENGQNTRVRNPVSGELANTGLRVAGVIGADYELPLNKAETFILAPEIGFSFGFTNVTSDLDW
ncbi:MAG: hypothetical protein UZ07_CHB004002244, partial [Chlorobi bacterium OLB7]